MNHTRWFIVGASCLTVLGIQQKGIYGSNPTISKPEAIAAAKSFLSKVGLKFSGSPGVTQLGGMPVWNVFDGRLQVGVDGANAEIRTFKDYERQKEWWYGHKPKTKPKPVRTESSAKMALLAWQKRLDMPKDAKFGTIEFRGLKDGHENFQGTARAVLLKYAHGYPYASNSWVFILDTFDGYLTEFFRGGLTEFQPVPTTPKIDAETARRIALAHIKKELAITGDVAGFASRVPALAWDLADGEKKKGCLMYRFEWRAQTGGIVAVDAVSQKIVQFKVRPRRR